MTSMIELREMIDAKLKGEGIDLEAEAPVAADTNVINLMAALKQSLGQSSARPAETSPPPVKRKKASSEGRQQAALKLPIKGGEAGRRRRRHSSASYQTGTQAGLAARRNRVAASGGGGVRGELSVSLAGR